MFDGPLLPVHVLLYGEWGWVGRRWERGMREGREY